MADILDHFPLKEIRSTQKDVLTAIQQAFKDGYQNIVVEAPVGSGKSAIAIAVAKYFGQAHILTPRKSLQNQYYDDFSEEDLSLMKGRAAYPCTYKSEENPEYPKVIRMIQKGFIEAPKFDEVSCAAGPCLASKAHFKECSTETTPCPYTVALQTAFGSKIIVHNLHSFIFQAYYGGKFDQREILIIDECHEIENTIRNFSERKLVIPKALTREELPGDNDRFDTLEDWADYLLHFIPLFSDRADQFGVTDKQKYGQVLETLRDLSDKFGEKFVPSIEVDPQYNRTKFSFIPERVGDLVNNFIFQFGKKRLLMSGTIYNKSQYCRNVGLQEESTCFIRIGSSFPLKTRPIYCKDKYLVDTSHKKWDENFPEIVEKIKAVMEVFHDVKGLIHTPSYQASLVLYQALRSTKRVIMHSKDDLQQSLTRFYNSPNNEVFLSPVCQQGVDFKHDRARFQIILRVPFASTSDAFNEYKVREDFQWYNYQALVIFGQQIGRINRAHDDFGVTVLMDERFGKFIKRNSNILPKWLTESIIYK